MSNRTIDEIYRFPEVNPGGVGQNTLQPTNFEWIWSDTDNIGLRIADNSFTTENTTIRVAILSAVKTTDTDSGDGFIMDNTTVIFDGDTGNGDNPAISTLQGNNRFRNCNFVRNESGGSRIVIGQFDAANRNATTVEFNNCRFVSTDDPFAILNFGVGDFIFTNNTLVGAVGGQFYQGFISNGTVWPSIGADDGLSSPGVSNGAQYYARAIHQDLTTGQNIGDDLPLDNAIFLIGDDVSISAANDVGPEFNHDGAMIKVNNLTNTDIETPSFHVGNRAVSATEPAAAYTILGWKPEFTDGENIVSDTRMSLAHQSYRLVDNDGLTPAAWLTQIRNNRVNANTTFDADQEAANYRGYWILTRKTSWTSPTNPASIPEPSTSSFRAWSFSHILDMNGNTNLQGSSGFIPFIDVVNANGATERTFGSVVNGVSDFVPDMYLSLADPLVGTLTATTAPSTTDNVTTLDEAYAALKRSWYASTVQEEWTLGDVTNSRLTLNRNLDLLTGNVYNLAGSNHNLNSDGLVVGDIITGINATSFTVELDNHQLPSGSGETRCSINGGTWVDPSDAQLVDIVGDTTLSFVQENSVDIRTWDFAIPDTANDSLTINNGTGGNLSITLTPAQFTLLGSPPNANGITYNQVEARFNLLFRNQALSEREEDGSITQIGGYLAIRRRPNDQADWGDVTNHTIVETVADGAIHTFSVPNEPIADARQQYLLIWRPIDPRYETSFEIFDLTGANFPSTQAAEPYTINATRIPDVLLPTGLESPEDGSGGFILATTGATAVTEREIARVTWSLRNISTDDGGDGNQELVGTITGSDTNDATGINRGTLNGSSTQTLLRSAWLDIDYTQLLVNRGLDVDIIMVTSSVSTEADGQYLQLTTGDGNQQQLTGLEPRDVDNSEATDPTVLTEHLQATISGTDAENDMISFPAVQIFDNPLGISSSQVRDALLTDLQAINGNVIAASVKPPAVQATQNGNVQI